MFNYKECEECCFDESDVLQEYEVRIRDIVQEAVIANIKNTVDDRERLIKELDNAFSEIKKLRNEKYLLEQNNKKDISELKVIVKKEAEKAIMPDFAPFDEVWIVDSDRKENKCTHCNGNFKIKTIILGKKIEVQCPHCSYGKVVTYNRFPVKHIISSVYGNFHRVDRYNKNLGIKLNINKIYLEKNDREFSLDGLYKSKEECQLYCDEKNAEEIKKLSAKEE